MESIETPEFRMAIAEKINEYVGDLEESITIMDEVLDLVYKEVRISLG